MPNVTTRLCRLTAAVAVALAASPTTRDANAATLTVTTTADGSVADECTLRDAIASANTNAASGGCAAGDAGHDDIVFAPGVTGTIALTEGELVLVEEANITGPGADALTIDAHLASRVLSMTGDESMHTVLTGLTFANGRTTADGDSGGGIRCLTALELVDSVVTGSSTAGPNAPGGGMFTATTTLLTRSTVSGNWTEGYGSPAGGVMVVFGLATLTDSTISDNWTEGDTSGGGGLIVFWGWFDATLINSTISGNATFGDASQAGGLAAGGNAFLINSTVSGNSTHGYNTGGGFTDASALSVTGNVTLTSSTIVDNVSDGGGASINVAGDTSILAATNSIIASPVSTSPLCTRAIDAANGTHNLATDLSCGSDTLVDGAPVAFEALALGALSDNGGATMTRAPLKGSVAIDAGDEDACAAVPVGNLDQRGDLRPVDGNGDGVAICDIGSVEVADDDTILANGFDP